MEKKKKKKEAARGLELYDWRNNVKAYFIKKQ